MERDITKATEKLSASTKKSSTTAADKCDSGGSTAVGAANGCTTEENNYHDRGPQASREKEGGHVVPFTSSSTNTRVSSPVMVSSRVFVFMNQSLHIKPQLSLNSCNAERFLCCAFLQYNKYN